MKKIGMIILFGMIVACSSQTTTEQKTEQQTQQKQKNVEEKVVEAPKKEVESIVIDEKRKKMGPMESIKDLDKQVESYHLGQSLTPEQIEENRLLKQKIIRGTFDIKELSRLALDKHWGEITTEQQKHFVDLMTRLLEKKAIFSKEQLRGENKLYRIEYKKETVNKEKEPITATVFTRMVVPSKKMDLNLTYKLLQKNGVWKIFDVIVDDASLLSNYRFQFDRIIQKSGYQDLVQRMEKKLAGMGGKEAV